MIAHTTRVKQVFFLHRFFQGLSFHLVQIFYNTFYLYRKINLKILSNNFFDIKKKKYLRERKSSTLKFSVFSSRANICVWNIFFFTTREQWIKFKCFLLYTKLYLKKKKREILKN